MIQNSQKHDEDTLNIHMNSVQFNKEDHQDLIYLNLRQNETVKDQTNEDLKTEIQNNMYTNINEQLFFNTDQDINDQESQFQQSSIYQKQFTGQDQNEQIDEKEDSKVYMPQSPSDDKINYSIQSKDSIIIDPKLIKSKFDPQNCQNEVNIKKSSKNPKRLIRAINLLVNVKSFYRLLTKNSRILGKLTKDQHYLINDSTSIFLNQSRKTLKFLNYFPKLRRCIQEIYGFFNNIFECIPIFQPYNLYKFLWDILQAILILSVMFLFSLITFFQMNPQYYIEFFQAVFVLFVLDMLFTFNTGVVEKGNVIFDRKKAAIIYLKKNFIMDQIALLPLFMFFLNIKLEGLYSWAIYFQILLKLFVLTDIFDRLTFYLNYQKNMKNVVDLVKLVFIIACVCHVFCLFWHGLAIYEIKQGSDKTWLQVREIEDAHVFTRYVQSFYYLAVTMITVGYGDITPQTTYEILFTTLTMFVTGFFYAFSLNRIGSIIENIEMKDKQYKESMQAIHRLMREENVSQTLRVQISNYLQYLYKESNEVGKQQEKEIIDKLSKQLKNGLIQDVQGKYLKEIEFIDKLETKSKIVEIMEECLFSPGEYIFQQGDQDDCALYYIVKGSVKIMYEYQDRDQTQSLFITQLHKSQYFGDIQFISGNARILTAQASDFCRTYKIPREQFFKCIKQSEQDFENFQMLKEAYVFKENQKLFQMKCYTCNKTDHISIKCPKTHLTLSKQTLIQKENKSIPHLDRVYTQRRYQKNNSLSYNLDIIDALFQFLDRDENVQDLQQIEDNLNFSQDEAYIEQQLMELQQLDHNEQLVDDQKNFDLNDKKIIEVGQDQESDYDEKSIQKNYFGMNKNKKHIQISVNHIDQTQNQEDQTELFDDLKSVQSNFSIKGIVNQFQRNKQKQLTQEKNQIRSSILEYINNYHSHNDSQYQSNEQNSSATNFTFKTQTRQKQYSSNNLYEEFENQDQALIQYDNNDEQQQHKVFLEQKIIKNEKSFNSFDKKNIIKKKTNQNQESQEKNNLKDTYSKIQYSQQQQQENSQQLNVTNSYNLSEMKKSLFKRRSRSLTNLQDEEDTQQDQSTQQNEYPSHTNQLLKARKNSKINKKYRKSISQKELRSSSFDEPSQNQVGKPTQISINSKESLHKNFPSIKEATINQEENINSDTTSISNINFSKQNLNNNSQSTIKSTTNKDLANNKDLSRKQSLQNQRRQSQKLTLLRQQIQSKRASQLINPLVQQAYLNCNSSVLQKNQTKNHINQINQYSQQVQSNQDLIQTLMKKRQSLAQTQIQNQINHNNINQLIYQQIIQQMNNSPFIAKRRSNRFCKNLIPVNSQELTRNKNQSSMVIDGLESSKLLPEKYRSSIISELQENNRKHSQLQKLDVSKYMQSYPENTPQSQLQINSIQQNNILMQENEIHVQLEDRNYIMIKTFDKANIFRFYYPNYNINNVIQALKQREIKQKNKKSFKAQASRLKLQTKRTLNFQNLGKANERGFKNFLSKEIDFNKSFQ